MSAQTTARETFADAAYMVKIYKYRSIFTDMYKAVAQIQLTHKTLRVESGEFYTKEMALEELRYFIVKALPVGESFKVVQFITNSK